MNWAEISLKTTTEGLEAVTGFLMTHGVNSIMIEDAADFNSFLNDTTVHWDYVDEDLMKLSTCDTVVKFYLADNPQGFETLTQLKAALPLFAAEEKELDLGELALTLTYKEEEEWETAWKKYYHPIEISDRLVIVPEWEEYSPKPEQKILLLNPGMAFGTGGHHTTRLCLSLLDSLNPAGLTVLDMGCGSGILSIASLLLGAESATGVDIDQLATKISIENATLNQVEDGLTVHCGNILADSALADKIGEHPADLILANIVADVIIAMAPLFRRFLKPDGRLIVSGIIGERAGEVLAVLREQGFQIDEQHESSDWVAAICSKESIQLQK